MHIGLAFTASVLAGSSFMEAFMAPRSSLNRRPMLVCSTTDPGILLGTGFGIEEGASSDGQNELQFPTLTGEEQLPGQWTSRRTKIQFRGLSTTAADPKRRRATLKSSKIPTSVSKSSTMPGFGPDYLRGLEMVEKDDGKQVASSSIERQHRRKTNGEHLYKTTSSVPESMIQFAEEIHEQERITRDEEIILGEKTQAAVCLQNVYDQLCIKLDREPTDEEWCAASGKINMEAISQTIEEGLHAKNKLVTSNLRMVQSVVNTYIRNGLSAQYNAGDMMQEGIIALIRAAEKFEPERGWKFSTYAMYWVRASVKRSQLHQSRVVTIPQRIHENYKRLLKVEKDLAIRFGRRPTREEMGAEVGLSKLQVDRVFSAMKQRYVSLDEHVDNRQKPLDATRNGSTLVDVIDHRTADSDHMRLERNCVRENLIDTLNRYLEPLEVELLLLRYGVKSLEKTPRSNTQPTIAQLSRKTGYKPDKVRRTIQRALKKLRDNGGEEWREFERALK